MAVTEDKGRKPTAESDEAAAGLDEVGELLMLALPRDVESTEIRLGELTVHARAGAIVRVLMFLRDEVNCQFKMLVDICGVDYPERENRFDVVYHLLSLTHNRRIRVKVQTDEDTPVPSVTGVFHSAGWFEREAWDMFGIRFSGHPDLRRILTDYGFEGYPLRKEFPLTGFVEVRYDEDQKRVVYEPVRLQQEFRNFDFLSPWEGTQEAVRRSSGDEGDK